MQVFALFYTITMLKNAIAKLKQLGIESRDIFVVPIKGKNDHHNNPNIKFPHFRNAVDRALPLPLPFLSLLQESGLNCSWVRSFGGSSALAAVFSLDFSPAIFA